jgi:hypothetical protein
MCLRLGKLAEPVQVPEFLAVYRIHAGSTSYANRMASFLDEREVGKRYLPANPFARLNHALRFFKRRLALERALRSKPESNR